MMPIAHFFTTLEMRKGVNRNINEPIAFASIWSIQHEPIVYWCVDANKNKLKM